MFGLEELKNLMTKDNVYSLLEYFNANPAYQNDNIVSQTICHNGVGKGHNKLYYYDNNKIFYCYSHCGSFDVFELIRKVNNCSLKEAIDFITDFLGLEREEKSEYGFGNPSAYLFEDLKKQKKIEIKIEKPQLPILDEYKAPFYNNLPQPLILEWYNEGISKNELEQFNIRFDAVHWCVVIPHYDLNNRLIGIRQRTMIEEQANTYGKYRPWLYKDIQYSSSLGMNLYGIHKNKDNIKSLKKVIVVEAEKSVIQAENILGRENNITVATCSFNITKFQMQILISLGVEELVFGFDKDYETGEQFKKYIQKIEKLFLRFNRQVNISMLYDKNNLLGYKCSPFDCGKETFNKLWENRVTLST